MAYTAIITENTAFPTFNAATMINSITTMHANSKQRRALSRLTHAELNDIGITPSQRTAECNRRFWQ